MRWRQQIGWLVAPTGVECHRRGSSGVRRPVMKLYSSRLRGTPPGEQIEGSLGLVSMRAAVDLFPRRAIIGSAASWGLPSIEGGGELYHGEFVRRNEEGLKVSKLRPQRLIKGIFWYRLYIRVPLLGGFWSGSGLVSFYLYKSTWLFLCFVSRKSIFIFTTFYLCHTITVWYSYCQTYSFNTLSFIISLRTFYSSCTILCSWLLCHMSTQKRRRA